MFVRRCISFMMRATYHFMKRILKMSLYRNLISNPIWGGIIACVAMMTIAGFPTRLSVDTKNSPTSSKELSEHLYYPIKLQEKLLYPIDGVRYSLPLQQMLSPATSFSAPSEKRLNIRPKRLIADYLVSKKHYLYQSIIHKAANRHKVDPALVKAIIMAESSYNPKAISKRGAKGLMQLMPETAKALGVMDIFDPEHNIDGGVRYFKRLVKKFNGDVKLALAAYNAGSRIVKKYQGIPPFEATHFYIKKVFKYYEYFKENTANEMKRT